MTRARKVNGWTGGQTEGRTDGGHNMIHPVVRRAYYNNNKKLKCLVLPVLFHRLQYPLTWPVFYHYLPLDLMLPVVTIPYFYPVSSANQIKHFFCFLPLTYSEVYQSFVQTFYQWRHPLCKDTEFNISSVTSNSI